MWPFKSKQQVETRSVAQSGYTAAVMSARQSYISGSSGIGELTATVQGCISLWEGALSLADVQGTNALTRSNMAIMARSLALRGEAVFLIRGDLLIPCSDWEVATRYTIPTAYRVSISDAGGGTTDMVLAGEVLHVRIGSDAVAPWTGSAPLRRSSLTAGMLSEVETALHEVYLNAPIGTQIIPYPESNDTDLGIIAARFRSARGRVTVEESTQVSAAGGATPHGDWKPQDTTPDLARALPREMLIESRNSIMNAFGVLPLMFDKSAQGPSIREAQRHLAGWTLQPIAALISDEATNKLGTEVVLDVLRPVQAYDAGGWARAVNGYLEALSRAKESGLSPADVNSALTAVNWGEGDRAA